MGSNIDPRLIKATALAKATQLEARLNQLIATSVTDVSPVVVYLEGSDAVVSVNGGASAGGTWTCPDGVSSVQVEAWGAGGGGSGGTALSGGGGGGGGEYALEQTYAVLPGNVYSYAVGRPGQGGVCGGAGGYPGGGTVFDTTGTGVLANGGGGGDGPSQQNGGTGSSNSAHFDGGNGGVSTAGVSSDDPTTVTNLFMWWRLDDKNAPGGTSITSTVDASGHRCTGNVITTGAGTSLTTQAGAPVQVPTKTTATSKQGDAAYLKQNTSHSTYMTVNNLSIGSTVASPYNASKLTISVWVKGDTALGTWGINPIYGHVYSTLAANCDYASGLHSSFTSTSSDGFALFLQGGQPVFYLNNRADGHHGTATGNFLPAPDGSWHQIVATWDGTTMKLYQDGNATPTGTATPGFSAGKFANGGRSIHVGVNPYASTNCVFTGTLSNLWIAGSAVASSYVTHAYGGSPSTGGSGGGASGGSAGSGASGVSASTSSGAAGGTAAVGTDVNHGGSGAGGAGGNSGANGSAGPGSAPYGGGGGGAGNGSSLSAVKTLTVECSHSASYCGIDATGGNNGVLYNVSDLIQEGIGNTYPATALLSPSAYSGGDPGSSFNGSLNSLARIPSSAKQLAGQTVNSVVLSFTVQSINASVLPVGVAVTTPSVLPPSLGSDSDITTYLGGVTPLIKVPVPAGAAGRRISFDITSTALITALKAGEVELVFGGLQGSVTYGLTDGAWDNPDSYAWNTVINGTTSPDPADNLDLTIEYWATAGSNTTGGDGAPGALIVSFIDTRSFPVVSIQPGATTDTNNNQLPAGIAATSIVGFDPTVSSPSVPETWHTLGSLAGGSGITVDKARYRFSPEDGGTLVVQFAGHTTGTLNSGGYTLSVTVPSALIPSVSAVAIDDFINQTLMQSNAVIAGVLRIGGKNSASPGQVSVQIPSSTSPTAALYAMARIPLT